MTEQLAFTYERPRSRRNDPPSSKRAEDQMRKSGALRGQALIAFELVTKYPGKSSLELAKLGTLDRYQLARRLPELLNTDAWHTAAWRAVLFSKVECRSS